MRKSIIFILAIILILAPLAASCETEPKSEESSLTSSEATLIEKDMNGRKVNIYCWDFAYGSKSILGYTGEVLYNDDEKTASSVDVAKKKVIDTVQEKYNCTISGTKYGIDKTIFLDTIGNMVKAGTNEYDIVFYSYGLLSPLIEQGTLMDLNTVSTIDFSNPWWDQRAKSDLSIANKLYFMCGDINTYDNDGTWCVLFNKTLKDKLGIKEDFYKLVKDDNWNFDKFNEIVKSGITTDSNGDNVLDEKDTWALGTETYNIYVHVVAGGDKIVGKDSNDIPYFTYNTERTLSSLDNILDLYLDKNNVMVANAPPYTGKGFPNVWEATVHKSFIEGRELFYICGLINVPSFRQMSDDFGILPIPKMYATQDSYYHTVSCHNMTVMALPSNVVDKDDLGIIIEALGKYSKDYLTPAYYDIQLKYRDTRDNESSEMLDLIFSTRSFDLGAAFNWGGTLSSLMAMDKNFVSRFESIKEPADTALQNTLDYINGNK